MVDNSTIVVTSMTMLEYEDTKNMFVDYLTYILHYFVNESSSGDYSKSFQFYNETLVGNTTIFDENETLSTTYPTTYMNDTNYEIFKSTVLPIFSNNTELWYDERFETELTTLYEEVVSAISTLSSDLPSTVETSSTSIECLLDCNEDVFLNSSNSSLEIATTPLSAIEVGLNYTMKARLRSLCWETMFGQELIKLTVMDLIMTIFPTLAIDFFRGIFVRVMNR